MQHLSAILRDSISETIYHASRNVDPITFFKQAARSSGLNDDKLLRRSTKWLDGYFSGETTVKPSIQVLEFIKQLQIVPSKPILLFRGMFIAEQHSDLLKAIHDGAKQLTVNQKLPTSWTRNINVARQFTNNVLSRRLGVDLDAHRVVISRRFTPDEMLIDESQLPVMVSQFLKQQEIITMPGRYVTDIVEATSGKSNGADDPSIGLPITAIMTAPLSDVKIYGLTYRQLLDIMSSQFGGVEAALAERFKSAIAGYNIRIIDGWKQLSMSLFREGVFVNPPQHVMPVVDDFSRLKVGARIRLADHNGTVAGMLKIVRLSVDTVTPQLM